MTASTGPQPDAIDATASFNSELFDRRCAEILGADATNDQRAELAGVDWTTIYRFKRGELGPRLEVARRIARRLRVSVDELWPAGER